MSTINSINLSYTDEYEQDNISNTGSILSFRPKESDTDVEETVIPVIILYKIGIPTSLIIIFLNICYLWK